MFISFLTEECLKERASWVFLLLLLFFFFFAGKQLRSADLNPHVVWDSKQDVWGYLVYTAGDGGRPRKTSIVRNSALGLLGVWAPCTPPFLRGSRFEQRPC